MSRDEAAELAAVHAFLRRYEADRERGEGHDAEHYAAAFPAHADAIRREFAAMQATGQDTPPNLRIGPYEVVRELGRGGQAVVYLARDERLQREVALKVLPRHRASVEQELRLQREATTAARLEDSGICPVYEVGHDGSHAFLAMRYVPGETLAARIETARAADGKGPVMPLSQLLLLFERLCASLHRAHEAGVVHRDLKPGNVMLGADGVPVLLDFGLAVDVETDGPLLTRSGDLYGTPAYLPPERLLGHSRVGDRRWDVWALGVSLYEACTLQRPFAAPTLDGLYRAILEEEPQPARRHAPGLPADLGHVLGVCLEKVPERRYQTAADLAADLRAVRLGEPIRAKPPSLLRRVRRWHRRYAVLATALWLCAAGLAAVIVVQRSLLAEVRDARDEAEDLNRFLVEKLLLGTTPREARGRELTAAEIFERAQKAVAEAFPDATRSAGTLHHVLGRAFSQLGRRADAIAAFERAVAVRGERLGPDARETLQSRRELASARRARDQLEQGLREMQDVLAAVTAHFGEHDEDTIETRSDLVELLLAAGKHHDAEQEARLVLDAREATRSHDHHSTLSARLLLSRCLVAQGRRGDAETIEREVLEARRRTLSPDSIEIEQSLTDLATLLHDRASYERMEAKWAEAEACYLEDLALATKLYPKTNPAYATVVGNVASFFGDRFDRETDAAKKAEYGKRSEQMFRESLAAREAVDGPESSRVATVCINFSVLLSNLERYEEAMQMAERGVAIRTRVFGKDNASTLGALNNRAIVLCNWKGAEVALPDYREMLTRAQANPEIDPTTRNIFERGYVVMLCEAKHDAECIAAGERFWPRAVAQWGETSGVVKELAGSVAASCQRLGRKEDAAIWLKRYR